MNKKKQELESIAKLYLDALKESIADQENEKLQNNNK